MDEDELASPERGRLPRSLYDFWREALASDDSALPERLAEVSQAMRRDAPANGDGR